MIRLYPNGFVVKSIEENPFVSNFENYNGIGRYVSWPLDSALDSVSKELNREMTDRWFGYYNALCIIPDHIFLQSYINHCKECKMNISVYFIESPNNSFITELIPKDRIIMGYDYSDSDMNTSCYFEDLNMKEPIVYNSFESIRKRTNQYGLLNTLEELQSYIAIRNTLINRGYDMEEYYNLTMIRISSVSISEIISLD